MHVNLCLLVKYLSSQLWPRFVCVCSLLACSLLITNVINRALGLNLKLYLTFFLFMQATHLIATKKSFHPFSHDTEKNQGQNINMLYLESISFRFKISKRKIFV
jgi:hypothetical protein